ncbi:MAG: hypothetical protein DBW72_02325 [Flavobacteriales bacterium]|nr:MAG: hypothetical protein DBW72_02325 [Flavobacteriales bacterium]
MNQILFLLILLSPLCAINQEQFTVYFPTDKSYMVHSSKMKLKTMIDSERIKSIVKIEGYTDSTASNEYNKELAEKRILDIKYYLIQNNIQLDENFSSKAIGEDFNQENEISKNRKVIITYISNINKKITDLKKGEKLALNHLNFQPGTDVFRDIAFPVLEDLLLTLKKREDIHIKIHGHICCALDDWQDLSTQRAMRVLDYLTKNGIDPQRLSHQGHGSSKPIHKLPEENEDQRKNNRRVEIEIVSIKE